MPRLAIGGLSIAQIEKILTQRRAEVAGIEAEKAKLEKRIHELDARLAKLGGATSNGRTPRAKNVRSLPQVIFEVLSKNAKPMRVRDLVGAVQKAGYHSNSPQFRNIVNQTLIKNERFAAAGRGLYQLKK